MKVLVVAADRQTLSVVRQLSDDVVATSICANALDKATAWRPDIVLIDLTHVDGHELAKCLREDSRERPLVGIMGAVDARGHEAAVDAGFDEFLVKPFGRNELIAMLKRVEARIASSKVIAERVRVNMQLTRETVKIRQKNGL